MWSGAWKGCAPVPLRAPRPRREPHGRDRPVNPAKRVIVTGLGCITPIGNTVEAFRESLFAGRTGIAPFEIDFPGALSPDPGLRFRTTAKVKDFDPARNPAQHLTSGVIAST